ncbi:antitoxin Xre/MbcA/ParS toxin-binding domain-containing protein [Paraburkholderia fungorum]|uniref:antitoxin Xre/MbcA/ParS toxin-binding domain-containing protein n=1 Tax=Paraburkholderia fungorum TaxID=134537 RepID=UPI000E70E451|nr:antitoxin Xre/MbcA/ParS toxin-binding domain-containing protein [Paraburkholderia fungorum]
MPTELEQAERLARIVALAQYVWESETDARQFLNASHPLLDGRTPLDASTTEHGVRRVEDLMWRVFYGIPV